jgi:hypothetical protein
MSLLTRHTCAFPGCGQPFWADPRGYARHGPYPDGIAHHAPQVEVPPLPKSGRQLLAVLAEHGWNVRQANGYQSLSNTVWQEIFAHHPDDALRKIQVGYLSGRLSSALVFQRDRGWISRSLRDTNAYIRSFDMAGEQAFDRRAAAR